MTMTLRELRRGRGLSLAAVEVLTDGVDISTLSRIERGKQQPRPETVVRIARGLNISATRLAEMLATAAAPDVPS